jgi:CheY-like chemotaxis protein
MYFRTPLPVEATTEVDNLLQIIGGTTELMENIWEGRRDAEKYFAMLRDSVQQAADVTSQLVEGAGGATQPVPASKTPADFDMPIEAPARPVGRKRCIMVVDDEPAALMMFTEVLTGGGYDVVTAQTGFECLDYLTRPSASVDLVVIDLLLPFMNGDETFRRLRAIAPDVPVLLTTGFIMREQLKEMFAAGSTPF